MPGHCQAMPGQCHAIAMALPGHCQGIALALPGQCHGNAMAMPWQCHGYAMAMLWQLSGNAMALAWQSHGNALIFVMLRFQKMRNTSSNSLHHENPPPCRQARSGVVASLSFGLPVSWCAVCWSAVCRSAVCILQILYRGPPPRLMYRLYRLRRPQLFFPTFFSCFFRTPSRRPFGPPKTSIVANLDPKRTPKWSPKSKKNRTSRKSEN